jgi:uncharacterized protein YbcI
MSIDEQKRSERPLHVQISNAVVRVIADYTGRGPTRARTTMNGSLVVVLLEDTLSKGERSLVNRGRAAAVLQMRQSYQEAMHDELVGVIEQLTGRRVTAFMSTNHADPDYGLEAFVLDGEAA